MVKTIPVRLLVVDRDARYGEWLKHHLGVLCPESTVNTLSLSEFERCIGELSGRDCDVLMLAAPFGANPEDPHAQGLQLLRRLREKPYFPAVIAVAEEGNELTAVRALQLGAVDYLPKRLLTAERLKTSVRLALRMIERRVARRIARLAYPSDADSRSISAGTTPAAGREAKRPRAEPGNGIGAPDVTETADLTVSKGAPGHAGMVSVKQGADASAKAEANSNAAASPGTNANANSNAAASPGTNANANSNATASAATNANANATPSTSANAEIQSIADASPSADAQAGAEPEAALDAKIPEDAAEANEATSCAGLLPPDKAPGGEFMPADFIPGYTIHAAIGESEKAAVYVATSAARGENVALKVSKKRRDDAAGRQLLEREYTAIVAIRDPSVVQIYDYGVHTGYEYLVMEYLPRGDLKARMQQAMTEQEALRYLAQITAALQVVHDAGLLHRDLKPPNVMLRENGDVALIDFGLARALDGSSPSTRTGVLRGSPYYMSPEQAMGEVLDARSDFYSLGIMYYEMLTGKKPYTGGSAMDVLQQHVNAPLPMLPKRLLHHEPLLLKLMAKSREDRFASAGEILFAIAARHEMTQAAGGEGAQMESSAA